MMLGLAGGLGRQICRRWGRLSAPAVEEEARRVAQGGLRRAVTHGIQVAAGFLSQISSAEAEAPDLRRVDADLLGEPAA